MSAVVVFWIAHAVFHTRVPHLVAQQSVSRTVIILLGFRERLSAIFSSPFFLVVGRICTFVQLRCALANILSHDFVLSVRNKTAGRKPSPIASRLQGGLEVEISPATFEARQNTGHLRLCIELYIFEVCGEEPNPRLASVVGYVCTRHMLIGYN